jgi:hypothetical protein
LSPIRSKSDPTGSSAGSADGSTAAAMKAAAPQLNANLMILARDKRAP